LAKDYLLHSAKKHMNLLKFPWPIVLYCIFNHIYYDENGVPYTVNYYTEFEES